MAVQTVRFITVVGALDEAEEQQAVRELRQRFKDIKFSNPRTGKERIHKLAIIRETREKDGEEVVCSRSIRRVGILKGEE